MAVSKKDTKEQPKKAALKKAAPKKAAVEKGAPKKTAPKNAASQIKKEATKPVKMLYLSDDAIDIEAFDKLVNADVPEPKAKAKVVMSALGSSCPQFKQPKVTRDNPKMAPPANKANYITELKVKLSTQELTATWLDGTKNKWLCSPNPKLTPKGNDVVGYKCGPKHTNYSRDAMAWFTAFKSRGMVYGFHNSQRVGIGVVSHGCVRVHCDNAKTINQNSWSGVTKISIVS
jgi:hypothetical protein